MPKKLSTGVGWGETNGEKQGGDETMNLSFFFRVREKKQKVEDVVRVLLLHRHNRVSRVQKRRSLMGRRTGTLVLGTLSGPGGGVIPGRDRPSTFVPVFIVIVYFFPHE